VLDLRERQGMTYAQIAAHLDVPQSTVEALLFRARKALRREFQLVSAERLAAIPGIGWAFTRALRLRDRMAVAGADLGNYVAPLAAGAMTAVIVTLPSAAPAHTVVTVSHPARPAAVAPPATADVAPPEPPAPTLSGPSGGGGDEPVTGVNVVGEHEAQQRAQSMPVQVTGVPETGLGVDPSPVLAQVPLATRSLP